MDNVLTKDTFEDKLITQKVLSILQQLSNILHNKIFKKKYEIFYKLKSFNKHKTNLCDKYLNDALKKEMTLCKLKYSLNIFVSRYKHVKKDLLLNTFKKWKIRSKMIKKINALEPEIKKEFMLKFANKKKEFSSQINQKEKKIKKLSEDIKAINDKLQSYKKTIKSNEEKEMAYNKNIRTMEDENIKIERDIKNINKQDKDNKKNKLEENISELEKKIKFIEDEIRDKENYFNSQFKDFNEMLDFFEKKADEIQSMKCLNVNPPSSSKEKTGINKQTKSILFLLIYRLC